MRKSSLFPMSPQIQWSGILSSQGPSSQKLIFSAGLWPIEVSSLAKIWRKGEWKAHLAVLSAKKKKRRPSTSCWVAPSPKKSGKKRWKLTLISLSQAPSMAFYLNGWSSPRSSYPRKLCFNLPGVGPLKPCSGRFGLRETTVFSGINKTTPPKSPIKQGQSLGKPLITTLLWKVSHSSSQSIHSG